MVLNECKSCRWRWLPRTEHPRRCPRCQSYWWNGKPVDFVDGRMARPQFRPPSKEECVSDFEAHDSTAIDGKAFWAWHQSKGWPGVVDWRAAGMAWRMRDKKQEAAR
jgi:hypothetical protein